MKQMITFCMFTLFSITCGAQSEFNESNNGLIYSEATINKLKFIVDSLNLKFKVCDLTKIYQSKLQAKAHYFSIEGPKVKEIKADLEAHLDFDEFIKKYPFIKPQTNLLVVKYDGKNYQGEESTTFSSIALADRNDFRMEFTKRLDRYKASLKGKWIFSYHEGSKSEENAISAFYFTDEFTQAPIPKAYAKMIQYADCMVDTSTQIFTAKALKVGDRRGYGTRPEVEKLKSYISTKIPTPVYDSKQPEKFNKAYEIYQLTRLKKADSLKNVDPQFMVLLNDATREAILNGGMNDELEEYVEKYISNVTALKLKRDRTVFGRCSMDQSPRIHALNIARLSAATINWEIFLRSHLDIMNDRFERMSDGSYAWGGRKTYIRELEVLDINVTDLVLGISLRMENPSTNHYYGNIGRLGRALAETKYAKEIEDKMIGMISDNGLDDLNRILIYYLFVNYNSNLLETQQQTRNKIRLTNAIKTMPAYLTSKFEGVDESK